MTTRAGKETVDVTEEEVGRPVDSVTVSCERKVTVEGHTQGPDLHGRKGQ